MCGIIGILLEEGEVAPLLRESLKRLEYRGYDSVGLVTIHKNRLLIKKDKGKIDDVNIRLKLDILQGNIGIGHTRWATHGAPSRINAHPQVDCKEEIAVVHNGIIENFLELRRELEETGHHFRSETDTEVIPHLIEEKIEKGSDLEGAVKETLQRLEGFYAIVALYAGESDRLICARNESPLVLGIKDGAAFCASDIPAFLPMTNKVVFVHDGEVVTLAIDNYNIESISNEQSIKRKPSTVSWTVEMAQKGGFPHFMLKEIHEQPRSLRDTLRAKRKTLNEVVKTLHDADSVYITAAGTANHAGIAGKYMFAELTDSPTQTVISSEFSDAVGNAINENSVVLAVSQSGETTDTLVAVKYARKMGAKIIGITNTIGSSITRRADKIFYTHAGPEIGVAATKTFLVQLASLGLISLHLANHAGRLTNSEFKELMKTLESSPNIVQRVIKKEENIIKMAAKTYANSPDFLFLGRGINTATAMEGALKLKEISYIHAEGYPAGESKHGPIALVETRFPVVFVAPPDKTHHKIIGNIMEMKARGARIIAVAEYGDRKVTSIADTVFNIPKMVPEILTPIPYVVPLQLLAYYAAVLRGYDPDKPRNLAKSVTVL
ncbi:MAG: glutamine--fructose-6-phosphate transaminase (isomerizing) [Promethearchaeota archaeon]